MPWGFTRSGGRRRRRLSKRDAGGEGNEETASLTALAIALLVAAAVVVPLGRRWTGDWLSPAALVLATWFGSLGLYLLMLLPYRPLDAYPVALIAAGLLALAGGIAIGTGLARRVLSRRVPPSPDRPPSDRSAERWVLAYSAAGIAGFIWYVADVAHYLGWEAFQAGTPIRRALSEKVIPSEYLFLEFFCVIAPLVALAYLLTGTRLRWFVLAGPILCLALVWLTTDRTHFFTVVLTAAFMIFLRAGPSLSFAKAVRVLAVAGILLVLNFWIVGAWLGKTPENLGVKLESPRSQAASSDLSAEVLPESSPAEVADAMRSKASGKGHALPRLVQKFSTLYLYATGSFAAFSTLVREPPQWTNGAHTLYPVVRALDRAHLWPGRVPRAIPSYRVITHGPVRLEYNAYTYLYYPYNDFGPAGVAIVSLAVGLACGFVYGAVRVRRDSPLALVLCGQVCLALVLSMFVNKFNNTASWYVAAFTALPFVVAGLRRPRRLAS